MELSKSMETSASLGQQLLHYKFLLLIVVLAVAIGFFIDVGKESPKSGKSSVSFIQKMLNNYFLLLTVVLAVAAAAFVGIGLFRLLSY